jgi:valyl-tRNA synthetase
MAAELPSKPLAPRDRFILSRLNATVRECNRCLEDYEFGRLTQVGAPVGWGA